MAHGNLDFASPSALRAVETSAADKNSSATPWSVISITKAFIVRSRTPLAVSCYQPLRYLEIMSFPGISNSASAAVNDLEHAACRNMSNGFHSSSILYNQGLSSPMM
jgi:hypothetical protein